MIKKIVVSCKCTRLLLTMLNKWIIDFNYLCNISGAKWYMEQIYLCFIKTNYWNITFCCLTSQNMQWYFGVCTKYIYKFCPTYVFCGLLQWYPVTLLTSLEIPHHKYPKLARHEHCHMERQTWSITIEILSLALYILSTYGSWHTRHSIYIYGIIEKSIVSKGELVEKLRKVQLN